VRHFVREGAYGARSPAYSPARSPAHLLAGSLSCSPTRLLACTTASPCSLACTTASPCSLAYPLACATASQRLRNGFATASPCSLAYPLACATASQRLRHALDLSFECASTGIYFVYTHNTMTPMVLVGGLRRPRGTMCSAATLREPAAPCAVRWRSLSRARSCSGMYVAPAYAGTLGLLGRCRGMWRSLRSQVSLLFAHAPACAGAARAKRAIRYPGARIARMAGREKGAHEIGSCAPRLCYPSKSLLG